MPSFFDAHGDPTMDPYTILSLPPTATEAEIKKAYRMQMLQLHPDKLASTLGDESIAVVTEKFHNVKDAYEFLVSPLHLTSRRLYMAKVASRRAEYERREAYMRRSGQKGDDFTAYNTAGGGVSGYRTGGGGAAGMAGTGMPHQQRHHGYGGNNSYPVPPKKKMGRSKSQNDFCREARDDGYGKDPLPGGGQRRGRGNGMYKNADRGRAPKSGNHPPGRKDIKRERNGYKSDTAGYTKTKSNNHNNKAREGRNHKARNKSNPTTAGKKEQRRQRTKSEPRVAKENKKSNRDATAKEKEKERAREERRRRARSAPARYSRGKSKNRNNKNGSNNSNQNLPKHFFCPLTKKLMKDPVIDTEGYTYDREAIERWLRVQSSSPITNSHLSLDMLKPDKVLKRAIHKATGKPRSKSQTRAKSRSRPESPTHDFVSGRVLVDSYLREISSKSKLSVSLDGMGICAFSYRRTTFVIEVPITAHAGFMVYSSFDTASSKAKLSGKMAAWNDWLANIGRSSRVSHVRAGQKTVFTLKGSEGDMSTCDVFQKTLEYFVEMSLKLHNLLHPTSTKVVANVCLTRAPVAVQ